MHGTSNEHKESSPGKQLQTGHLWKVLARRLWHRPGISIGYTEPIVPMTDTQPARRYRFGVFEADASMGELRRQGVRVKLNAQPFQVLCLLLDRPGELLTREEISRELWPDGTFVDYDHGVNSAVNRIREALGDTPAARASLRPWPRGDTDSSCRSSEFQRERRRPRFHPLLFRQKVRPQPLCHPTLRPQKLAFAAAFSPRPMSCPTHRIRWCKRSLSCFN